MNLEEKIKRRRKNLNDALNFREPAKVPIGFASMGWPFSYAGERYDELVDNPQLAAEIYCKYLDDFEFDFVVGTGVTQPVKAYAELGFPRYKFTRDGIGVEHNQTEDIYLTDEEFKKMPDNYDMIVDNLTKKRYPSFQKSRNEAYEDVKRAALQTENMVKINNLVDQRYKQLGLFNMFMLENFICYYATLDMIFTQLRGIKQTLLDIRRNPGLLDAVREVILQKNLAMLSAKPEDLIGKPLTVGGTGYHSECFLSPKQFEKYFMADFIKYYKPFMEAGLKVYLLGEGSFLHTLDFFKDLPKGSIIFHPDSDDTFDIYNKIGGWHTILGGARIELLKYGTVQQNIDYAKKSFNTMAPGGGFLFLSNKGFISAKDVDIDNLRAVYEFVNDYAKK